MNTYATLPAPAFTAAIFDVTQFCVLGEMEEEGDFEILSEVVSQFLEDAAGVVDRLGEAIEEEDFHSIIMQAHTLKGSFATFGLMRAHALAQEIEHLAEDRRPETLHKLFRELTGNYRAGQRALETHMGW